MQTKFVERHGLRVVFKLASQQGNISCGDETIEKRPPDPFTGSYAMQSASKDAGSHRSTHALRAKTLRACVADRSERCNPSHFNQLCDNLPINYMEIFQSTTCPTFNQLHDKLDNLSINYMTIFQ